MEFNDPLLGKKIDPAGVIVFRHRPSEPELNKVFPLIAADRPDLFNHRPRPAAQERLALLARTLLCSDRSGVGFSIPAPAHAIVIR
ncbi:hypothetical protein N2603_11895 [Bradyrhizobium huanghuaihaiense]|uniref:hypothetical protein n=1 Tax=Bradyrhizobium huanghuaihaiense TaxID=990078 RepID=UPI0021A9D55E|nr:hypothetical protein [Bradyrhizobium sp. CB3035]UWU79125.1 hypothetical protein N2603_11895 [Bradyrhizobium sp. CB3035]